MGWLFEYNTQDMTRREYANDMLKKLTHAWPRGSSHVITHSLQGNHLWAVVGNYRKDTGQITKHIFLALLKKSDGMWGYKDMDEDCHPYYYTCPLRLLRMTKPRTQDSLNWRQGVREHLDRVNRRRKLIKLWRTDRVAYHHELQKSA